MVIDGVASGKTLTVSANDVIDVEAVSTTSFKLHYLSVNGNFPSAVNEVQGSDIASASTINLTTATGNLVDVTGTTTITAITLAQGAERWVRFTGALTLTNGASLVLLGGANIVTAAGDYACFRGYAAGVVRMTAFFRAAALPALANAIQQWTKPQVSQATDTNNQSGSVTPDFGNYQNFVWTLTGTMTALANPTLTSVMVGQKGTIEIIPGSYTTVPSFGTYFKRVGSNGGAQALSTVVLPSSGRIRFDYHIVSTTRVEVAVSDVEA
jgi:hypothetical protein